MGAASDIRAGSKVPILAGILGMCFVLTGGVALLLDVSELWTYVAIALALGSALLGLKSKTGPLRRGWSVVFDDEGVYAEQVFGPLRHVGRVPWSELVEVGIVTSGRHRATENFHWVLIGESDTGCVVPQGLAEEVGLFSALRKLPGFDYEAVVQACGSATGATFRCWRGRKGQGGVASEGL